MSFRSLSLSLSQKKKKKKKKKKSVSEKISNAKEEMKNY